MSPPDWELLSRNHPFDERSLAETLLGGQAFRWFRGPEPLIWTGVWSAHVVRLRIGQEGALWTQRLSETPLERILSYLGIDRLPRAIASLPCGSDPVLERLHGRWSGLSILRQPHGETVLAFICSSNKRIPHIRSMLHQLSERFGEGLPGTPFKTLPTWQVLARAKEADLRGCGLGYRARHVAGTAALLDRDPELLERVATLPTVQARELLLTLPGIGPKVAECILLFGYGRMECFPVDTWIARLMESHYPDLRGWKREQIATFARLHYGRAAGLAQQWLFAERNAATADPYATFDLDAAPPGKKRIDKRS